MHGTFQRNTVYDLLQLALCFFIFSLNSSVDGYFCCVGWNASWFIVLLTNKVFYHQGLPTSGNIHLARTNDRDAVVELQ